MLCENLDSVGWYMRSNYALEHLKREYHNPSYLSAVEFHIEQLELSNDINEVVANSDIIIFAVPSAFHWGRIKEPYGFFKGENYIFRDQRNYARKRKISRRTFS